MFPVVAIILFFGLGLAFFILSSKNDFGMDNIKNRWGTNDKDQLKNTTKEEKPVEEEKLVEESSEGGLLPEE
tara:strand:+ start:288 stop:503 length:216 start_codon:yes stop_codon:yes gene_type:complete